MNGQLIPGFYWDPEKKKYFKIQSQNAARGLDLRYSAENIRKAEHKEKIQKAAAARSSKIRKERVVRRNPNSIIQTSIERELGSKRRSYYFNNLWTDVCAFGINTRPKQVISRRPCHASIRVFDRDPVSRTIYAVQGSNSVNMQRIRTKDDPPTMETDPSDYYDPLLANPYAFHPWDEVTRTTSTASSLTYLPATGALAVTTYGSDRPPEVWLSDPERDQPYVGQKFTPRDCTAIWTASARPTSFNAPPTVPTTIAASQTEHLAVAASSSLLLFTRSQCGTWDSTLALKPLSSDILALEWLSYTTLALGSRDGSIRLYDTRSGGSSHILSHPYPISKLKRADDASRLVCSGLEDSLCLYDLRSPRQLPKSNNQHHQNFPKRRKYTHGNRKAVSTPLLVFEHANREELDLDIAVHPRLGLLAAAQDLATGTAIRVSNLYTGKMVREIKCEGKMGKKEKGGWESIRSLKFVEGEGEESGGVELWSCWNGGIGEFSW
ncbi:hypothetical protein COCCADRAFT_88542 [Bipolaris zeicola 26-R-13]|uniref:WD40 repeat-like protein n=1 Tax=Cochliobolus carbonum (strain 26-R-13) TaxID=930089 RepID=W6YY24_COCC2|nr:uncharacterized protein COCCADRAFT_88542 [Bipolaris zeicola 26-R-13]EUC36341.1 hypothetical protein COCCADRAFT_88542 [Bipolaris zeicola 26-R-13]